MTLWVDVAGWGSRQALMLEAALPVYPGSHRRSGCEWGWCALLFTGTGRREWRDYVPWHKCTQGDKNTDSSLWLYFGYLSRIKVTKARWQKSLCGSGKTGRLVGGVLTNMRTWVQIPSTHVKPGMGQGESGEAWDLWPVNQISNSLFRERPCPQK